MSNARKLADNLPSEGQLGNRNLLINGAMQVSQRGDSTSISTQGYYGPDRFNLGVNGRDQWVVTISTTSDAPDGYSNSYKLQTTTAETSITDTEYVMVRQIIEAQNLQHLNYGTSSAKQLTASFWVKSSIAATFGVFMYQYDGGRTIGSTYTINSANTWEYKTVTFAGDTGGTINDDNGNGQYLGFTLAAGSDLTTTDNTSWGAYTAGKLGYGHSTGANAVMTTTNATWQVTGVQLEVGSQATPFEHEPYSVTLAKCQRYYAKIEGPVQGYPCWSYSNVTSTHFSLPEKMRTIPSVTFTGTTNTGTNAAVTDNTFSLYNHNTWLGTSSGNGTQYGGTSASSTQSIRINTYPHSAFTSYGISAGLYFGQNCSINADAEL